MLGSKAAYLWGWAGGAGPSGWKRCRPSRFSLCCFAANPQGYPCVLLYVSSARTKISCGRRTVKAIMRLLALVLLTQLDAAGSLRAEAACDCTCCTSVYKPPIQGDGLMCAPRVEAPAAQDDPNADASGSQDMLRETATEATQAVTESSCPEQCQVVEEEAVTASAAGAVAASVAAVDSTPVVMMYASYCFSKCAPGSEAVGDTCLAVNEVPPEVAQALEEGPTTTVGAPLQVGDVVPTQVPSAADRAEAVMNARDPVQLEAPTDTAREAPTMEDAGLQEEAAVIATATTTTALPTPDTGALVAEAQGRFATASSLEARAAKAEVQSSRFLANSSFSLQSAKSSVLFIRKAKAEIAASATRAAIYAASAKQSAATAAAELAEMERIPQEAADFAAAEAEREFWAEANATALKMAQEDAMLKGPPPPAAAGPAALRAAAPYHRAMDITMDARASYDSQARRWSAQSQVLYGGAQARHVQAHELQAAGHTEAAKKTMEAAKQSLSEAVAADQKAEQLYGQAKQADEQLPRLMADADFAAQTAGEMAGVRWMPPPMPVSAAAPAFLATQTRGRSGVGGLRGRLSS
eukprot:TRINITY_DN92550_c0_g1_i1.p1 TRINITY_DN92550_c0_g1~~TRINITY_DN92550_c0_g1_i1.p1  ORF type:complete len:582 (-),score=153.75 TRINITY_DN92550_c0_g1_i1:33-1778(-)